MKRIYIALIAIMAALPLWAADEKPDDTPAKPFVYIPNPNDIVVGKDNAPVTVVEYASLSCPHCAHFYNEIFPQLSDKYIETGKIRYVYRHYPLNEPALKAALLVDCADKDRRPEFLKVLFKQQPRWAFSVTYADSLANIGALGGIERAKVDKCLNDKSMENSILEVEKEATDMYKVNETPTFFVNGVVQHGDHSLEAVSKVIDAALAAKAKK